VPGPSHLLRNWAQCLRLVLHYFQNISRYFTLEIKARDFLTAMVICVDLAVDRRLCPAGVSRNTSEALGFPATSATVFPW
jgi:hypothetical protein